MREISRGVFDFAGLLSRGLKQYRLLCTPFRAILILKNFEGGGGKAMRLFIAIRLNESMRDALVSVQSFLRESGVQGNYTREENLHLTLAFIGEYSDPAHILETMRTVDFQPFSICLEGFGSFGSLYWSGIGESGELSAYGKRLRRSLAEHGIPFDRKKFSPHITLIRKASNAGFPGVVIPDAGMDVDTVSLMRSDRGKHGMIYTEIGCVFAK